ncbi:GTPase RsgA, partial [Streptomyces sp. WAC06614]|uniref:GTPase RsgA n=1 Tax=Streptomyces sp. WAC06614 TaxID=2487416 RepID=UPI0021AE8560
TPHDPLRVVCTGDWVAVDPAGAVPRYVRAYLPRRTAFVRSTSSKRSEGQILAANVDHAVVAVSLALELDLARIERFLALAWESGAQPVVVLTKADLVPDGATRAHLVRDVENSAPGVPVVTVSAMDGDGLDVLAAIAAGGTSVLLGQSGAGKSTLANALLGEDVMDVQATRDVDGKGRHTTTTRNLLVLPGGGVLIDTPGLRGVGLWDAGTGDKRTDAPCMRGPHVVGAHGGQARLPARGGGPVAGDVAVGGVDLFVGFQDLGVCRCCLRMSVGGID